MDTTTALRITRTYAAPAHKVYDAWTKPEALRRWFAPDESFQTLEVEIDVRVGGRYRIVLCGPDGELHRVGGLYREVTPPTKIVFTWAWESTPERESLVTVELIACGDRTQLVLTHERFADAAARDRHEQGWAGCLDRLPSILTV